MKKLGQILFLLFFVTNAYSLESNNDEDFIDYENIVKELSPTTRSRTSFSSYDPLSQVRFHVGVGFTNSMPVFEIPNVDTTSPSLKGVSARLGVDLLSQYWRAEGGLTTYETAIDETGNKFQMKEFDLNLVYHSYLSSIWSYKWGMGFSARYLDFTDVASVQATEYSTPALGAQLGIFTNFGPRFSIGTEINYRRALSSDTPDKSAIDLSLRIDGHF